jgi:predicted regulator of Ras-like GTPase activity (Roadblock/LC7/MglB family)
MADPTPTPTREAAARALDDLRELTPDLRGGVILAGGEVLASSGDGGDWGAAATELLEAAERAGPTPVEQVHVAAEEGEVFAVRAQGLTAVAVTERFVLASLMAFDMRAALRELGAGGKVEEPA